MISFKEKGDFSKLNSFLEKAREAMKRANSNRDAELAAAELSRAMSRIKASKKKHNL